MKKFRAELGGIITRDITWIDVEAVDETQARAKIAEKFPRYRIRVIYQVD